MPKLSLALKKLITELESFRNDKQGLFLARFFKTGPGQYAAGDIFWGLSVPKQRQIAKKYQKLSLDDLSYLLSSPIHEQRLVALIILIYQYESTDDLKTKKRLVDFYWQKRAGVNNWDLVDISAHHLLGDYLLVTKQGISRLLKMTASPNLWTRRIAMVSTFSFIRAGRTKEAFMVAKALLGDQHDLIHKAVGWMLREAGKRGSETALIAFLDRFAPKMPRTALRYAIERLSPDKRRHYLNIKKVL